jgi:signal peptidase I
MVRWLALPMAALVLLHAFALGTFRVDGNSMQDCLAPGDLLLVSKLAVTAAQIRALFGGSAPYVPRRGDLVVFRLPQKPSLILVKRVIGVPGDRVRIDGDEGFDGVVPPAAVFVLGDNRTPGASVDSRSWGYLPCSNIIGRAVLRLLPIRRAELFAPKLP